MKPTGTPRRHPTAGRRLRATIALLAMIVLFGIETVVSIVGIALMGGIIPAFESWEIAYDGVSGLLALVHLAAFITTGVLFIQWQRSMTRNLPLLGDAGLNPGLGVSTWGWFLPVFNWVIPCVSMLQIARRSAPPDERPAVALVGWWWGAWIVGNVSGSIGLVFHALADSPRPWIAMTAFDVAFRSVLVFAGVLAIQMVGRLTRQQDACLAALPDPCSPAAPPAGACGTDRDLVSIPGCT